jgi:tetratricopeptide (TPR) repeat protein
MNYLKFFNDPSAAELFELFKPAVFVFSALASSMVLASGLRRGLKWYLIALWTLGCLWFVPVVLPLYLVFLLYNSGAKSVGSHRNPDFTATKRRLLAFAWFCAVTSVGYAVIRHDRNSIDAHLSRAITARVEGNRDRATAEYKAALALEPSPHNHNLLGTFLFEQSDWQGAVTELQAAEAGNEPDPLLNYRLAQALQKLGRTEESIMEFRRLAEGETCRNEPSYQPCESAEIWIRNLSVRTGEGSLH